MSAPTKVTAGRSSCLTFYKVLLLLFIISVSSVSSKVYNLKPTTTMSIATLSGHKAKLPCELPLPGDRPTLILWYKDQDTKPFYSFDARETASGRHKIHVRSDLSMRSKFTLDSYIRDFKVRLGYLEVNNVSLADTGNYTCRVDFMTSQTMMALLHLNVHDEIHDLEVFDGDGSKINQLAGPYAQGRAIRLTCRALGGYPSPVVQWMSGDEVLESSVEQGYPFHKAIPFLKGRNHRPLAMVKVILRLPDLQRHDDGSKVKCVAFNSNITRPLTRTVSIDMFLPPLEVQLEGLEKPVLAGSESMISCSASGSKPPATLTWNLQGSSSLTPLPAQSSVDQNTTQRRARLLAKPEDNGKILSCTATNPKVSDYLLETSHSLQVYFSPEVEVRLAPALDPENIREGGDVYFECVIKANPKASRVIWYHQGEQLNTDFKTGVLAQEKNLVLQKVSRKSSGTYQCQVTNIIDTVTSPAATLNVMFVPECSGSRNVTISVTPTDEVKLVCHVESNPEEVNFTWKVNSSRGAKDLSPSSFSSIGGRSTLLYRPSDHAMPNDQYGVVLCSGTNKIGQQKNPCMFVISPAGPPDKPKSCLLRNQSATFLYVTCEPGRSGGLDQHFIATILNVETGEQVARVTSAKPQFSVKGLAPGGDYLIRVTAVNKKGASKAYVLEGFALKVAENKINDSNADESSPMLAVFVGVVSGFVLILILLAVVNRLRSRRRQMRLNTTRDENKQSGSDEVPLSPSTNDSIDDSNDREIDVEDNEDHCSNDAIINKHQGGSFYHDKVLSNTSGHTSQTYVPGPPCRRSGSEAELLQPKPQQLHSVDLPHVTSNNQKYYTLKINCTRQNNESFV